MGEDDGLSQAGNRETACGPVVFDPEDFRRQMPRFADLSDAALNDVFARAELIVWQTPFENGPASSISLAVRKALLYALTCHLATLDNVSGATGGLSGAITSAREGSVSVTFAQPETSGKTRNDWLAQTECGRFALMILKKHRTTPRLHFGRRRPHDL